MNRPLEQRRYIAYQHTSNPIRFCIPVILTILASILILLFGQVRPAGAAGVTIFVQIHGPTQQPAFSPALLSIHIYDTVIFVNQSKVSYAIAADDNSFSSPAIKPNQQWPTTFSVLGAHAYHATSTASNGVSIAGEILVVSDSVALLPTPQPQIEATALAIIQAGKHPPDVIQLPTTTTVAKVHHNTHTANTLQSLLFSTPFRIGIGGVLALLLLIISVTIVRRRHRTTHDEEFLDDEDVDLYGTYAHQHVLAPALAASSTLVAPDAQKAQATKRARHRQLFHSIRTRLWYRKDTDSEDEEGDEDEA